MAPTSEITIFTVLSISFSWGKIVVTRVILSRPTCRHCSCRSGFATAAQTLSQKLSKRPTERNNQSTGLHCNSRKRGREVSAA